MLTLLRGTRAAPRARGVLPPTLATRAPASMTEADWQRLRGPLTTTDTTLTRHALAWLGALPAGVRPAELAQRYPRIANKLAVCWDDPVLTELVMIDLLIDRRGGRQGFAPAIAGELMRLRQHHERRQLAPAADDPWALTAMATADR